MANVREFGARGDGQTDDTQALLHAIQKGDGLLYFPQGDYRITRTLPISLALHGRTAIHGEGGRARILMTGSGPAIHLVGSHGRTAEPSHFNEAVWLKERLPTVRDLEIVGQHPEADGIRIEGTMQSTLQTVLIRKCRNGIHIPRRARNVLIADCHVYDNHGIGIFLDQVNLHQIIIHGSHVSYNKKGGLVVVAGEVRNIQICSNDIEYNYDDKADTSHDILFDCREGTLREGTLVGNTVQARGSAGGANFRLLGAKDHPNAVGLFTVTGNLIGSQSKVFDLHACRGVVLSGNSIYSGYHHSIWAEDCEHLVIAGNSIDHNPEYRGSSTDQMVLKNCRNVSISGMVFQHTRPALEPVDASMLLKNCQNVNMVGMQIVGARGRGIALEKCGLIRVADSTIRGAEGDGEYRAALTVDKECSQVMVTNNFLGRGTAGDFQLPAAQGQASGNVMI